MRKIFVVLFLIISCRNFPSHDCVQIGMKYQPLVLTCGKPHRFEYRNGYLSSVTYFQGKSDSFTVWFEQDETVKAYRYKTTHLEIINDGE